MLNRFAKDAAHIFVKCGPTDFRKQIDGLVAIVNLQFRLDPFSDQCVFIFCNKRKTSIKVLRYDKNGFILANKKLLEGMKFQWPRNPSEIKEITYQQMEWLLQGLEMEQKKALTPVEIKYVLKKHVFKSRKYDEETPGNDRKFSILRNIKTV